MQKNAKPKAESRVEYFSFILPSGGDIHVEKQCHLSVYVDSHACVTSLGITKQNKYIKNLLTFLPFLLICEF